MDRLQFSKIILGTLGSMITPPIFGKSYFSSKLTVNANRIARHLSFLSKIGKNSNGGVTRLAFSDEDLEARSYLQEIMINAGLSTRIDAAGNLIGMYEGKDKSLPSIMTGSHIDTVPKGGNYDGTIGVISAIEVAQTFKDNGTQFNHPLEIIVFSNEEGGKTGSKAISGELTDKALKMNTYSGNSIWDGIKKIGGDPNNVEKAKRKSSSIKSFVELHIEQGKVLESENKTIGVVDGIVGIKRWEVLVTGFANHAGTTPMEQRTDALLAASIFIQRVNAVINSRDGAQVGTVGKLEVSPNAPNVVPGEVKLTLEIRDLSMNKIDQLYKQIKVEAKNIRKKHGAKFDLQHIYTTQSAICDTEIKEMIKSSSQNLGLRSLNMPSGAGHDAQSIATVAPTGMIFIPSKGGISHSPDEYTSIDDVVSGSNVLLRVLRKLDKI